ncbi:MAG: hypothetical protein WC647_13260 [Desulfomonilaceae bacterium]
MNRSGGREHCYSSHTPRGVDIDCGHITGFKVKCGTVETYSHLGVTGIYDLSEITGFPHPTNSINKKETQNAKLMA